MIRPVSRGARLAALVVALAGVCRLTAVASAAEGQWSSFDVFSEPNQQEEVGVYDPVHDRVVVFGGDGGTSPINSTRTLSLGGSPAWTPLLTQGRSPDGRVGPAGAYDSAHQRMIVIGGSNAFGYLNDVWSLSLGSTPTWTQLFPGGTAPAGRSHHTAIYDSANDRVIVFGGQLNSGGALANDVWALNLSPSLQWVQLAPAGMIPSGRAGHVAIYDPPRQRMVVFGGGLVINDVWGLSLSGVPTWSLIEGGATQPPGLYEPSAIYDPNGDRMLVFGGLGAGNTPSAVTWSLSLSAPETWTQVSVSGSTPARYGHVVAYDPIRSRMLVADGTITSTWSLSLGGAAAWSDLYASGTYPPSAGLYAYDGANRRYVFVESATNATTVTNSGWTLSIDEPVAWKRFVATGEPVHGSGSTRWFPDFTRNRMIVFFPSDSSTWTVSLGDPMVWTKVTTSNPAIWLAAPSYGQADNAYDSARDRWIIMRTGTSEMWALNLAGTPTWSQIVASGPSARTAPSLVYDPLRDRILLFGGSNGAGLCPTAYGDVWQLSLIGTPAWTPLFPSGTAPAARWGAGFIYDSTRDRFVMNAGMSCGGGTSDIWTLSADASPAWTLLATNPASNTLPLQAYDAVQDRGIAESSPNGSPILTVLSFGPPAKPSIACPPDLASSVAGVNLVNYLLTNHQPSTETYDFQINSTRSWPSFPLRGRTSQSGFSASYIPVGIPVPDTAAGASNLLKITVWRRGDTSIADSCSHSIGTPTAGVQVSLANLEAQPGLVRLAWSTPDPEIAQATVFRRGPLEGWTELGAVRLSSQGLFQYEDRSVLAGHRYYYRLGYVLFGAAAYTPDVRVDVPLPGLSLAGATPNPALGRLRITYTLPTVAPVRAEVFDLSGRRVLARDLPSALGTQSIDLADGHVLRSGLYLVKVSQGVQSRTVRAIFMR